MTSSSRTTTSTETDSQYSSTSGISAWQPSHCIDIIPPICHIVIGSIISHIITSSKNYRSRVPRRPLVVRLAAAFVFFHCSSLTLSSRPASGNADCCVCSSSIFFKLKLGVVVDRNKKTMTVSTYHRSLHWSLEICLFFNEIGLCTRWLKQWALGSMKCLCAVEMFCWWCFWGAVCTFTEQIVPYSWRLAAGTNLPTGFSTAREKIQTKINKSNI